MKKILGGLAVLTILVLPAWAGHVKRPDGMPPSERFELYATTEWECGNFKVMIAPDNVSTDFNWGLAYLGDSKIPLIVTKQSALVKEFWLDKDRDGHIDEYFGNRGSFYSKYPTPCDAVK